MGLLVAYLESIEFDLRRMRADVLYLLLCPLGLMGYMLFLWKRFGTPLQFVYSQVAVSYTHLDVYKRQVHHENENRIAVKFLRPDADVDADSEAIRRKRFHDEASALAEARHPNLVTFFDAGELPDGQLYMMMELVDGTTLREFVAQQGGRLSVPLASGLIRQTASALAYIHSRGIVHRDLNLRNLMVVKDEAVREGWRIKILDFGIAKFLNHQEMCIRDRVTVVASR